MLVKWMLTQVEEEHNSTAVVRKRHPVTRLALRLL